MDEQKIKQIAQNVYDQNSTRREYSVSKTSFHTHNGTDSQKIKQNNIIPGTTSLLSLQTINSETITIETIQNITLITVSAIATNGLGQKASMNGNAQLGNCYKYNFQGNITTIPTLGGSYQPFLQSFNTTYIDTSDVSKFKVQAGVDSIILVKNDLGSTVAETKITKWTGSSIVFETTLATNWQIFWFISMS